MKPTLLIPAYKPSSELVNLVDELLGLGAEPIIVVDDGSGPEHASAFEQVRASPHVTLLRHAVNLGKGRALKTGMNHYLLTRAAESPGLLTLDADGQHRPRDVMTVASALERDPGEMHLGVRQFGDAVPFRSRFGNTVTRWVFGVLTGIWVRDTQTGLRGVPANFAADLMVVQGERYEYEIGMLLRAKERRVPIREHPIQTVYIDGNRGSHFNPVLDSMRIYFVLLRFASSSMLTSFVDFVVFSIVFGLTGALGWSLVSGRIVASMVQFMVNRSFVFHSSASPVPALLRYYLLVVVLGATAYVLIDLLRTHVGGNVVVLKALVETLLFFASYALQSAFVFRSGTTPPSP